MEEEAVRKIIMKYCNRDDDGIPVLYGMEKIIPFTNEILSITKKNTKYRIETEIKKHYGNLDKEIFKKILLHKLGLLKETSFSDIFFGK